MSQPVSFDHAWLLSLAIVLPVLAVVLIGWSYRRRRKRLARMGQLDVVSRLIPPNALQAPGWRMTRVATAACLAGIAIAGPRWGQEHNIEHSSGIDLVLSLDASLSMMAQDVKPNRLEQEKEEVRRLLAISGGDRVGLIAFAGRSYILTPLTVDRGALDLFLDNLDPTVVGEAGTSRSRTIRQGTDLLMLSNSGADKALVVMSDGEAFEDTSDIVAEAQRAGEHGVSLVTVGFGTETGATIPVKAPDGTTTLKRDENGQVVVTKYHPETLKAAADAAHGTFIDASATDKATRIRSALATLRTRSRAIAGGDTLTPRYQYFLVPAVFLLLLDTLLVERRGRRRRRPAAAETAAAAVVLFALWTSGCARVTQPQEAGQAYHAGQYARAAQLYRSAIEAGDKRPEVLYDFGTALVGADSLQSASDALDHLGDVKDAELRYRALFNKGLANLKAGLAAPKGQGNDALDAALAAYKKVLLARPADMDAKWNYELALRKKKSGGGGGGGANSQGGGGGANPQSRQPQPAGGLGQQQADQILGSAAREERDTQAKRQQQNRVEPPPGGKDW